MTLKDKYGVEFQKELDECKYIPIWSTCTFSKMRLIASILGEEEPVFLRIRVVKERTVEDIDESIKRAKECFDKVHQQTSSNVKTVEKKTIRVDNSSTETVAEITKLNTIQSERIIKEEERRKLVEKRKQEQEQTAKENRRIIIIVIIAILGCIMLFNAKCSKTRSHHYDYFDPGMEYKHSD